MARELRQFIWCDVCLGQEDGAYSEAEETPPITIPPLKPRVLALCDVHRKEFEHFRELLTEYGQIVDAAQIPQPRKEGPATGEFPCPVPDCPKVYTYRSSLDSHCDRVHGKTLRELREEYGGEDALFDEAGAAPAVTRAECDQPDCDTVYEWPGHKRPAQALGVHKRQAHGIKSPKKAGASDG